MNISNKVLFKLLRIALGNEEDFSLPLSVNWKEVIDLSFEQGVAALAVDGLQRIYDEMPSQAGNDDSQVRNDALEALDSPELEDLKYEWFGEVMNQEQDYEKHNTVLHNLCSFWASKGLRTVLLKGIGLSRYYPSPTHRHCGDIDVFLISDSNSEPYDLGNALIENLGIKVSYENTKHSVFSYQGVMVENHKTLLNVDQTKALRKSNEVLSATLKDFVDCGEGYLLPSPVTNYIFLLRHILIHFLASSEQVSVRHLLDWGLFLDGERNNLDIEQGNALLAQTGLTRVKEIFTRLAQYVTGCDLSFALEREYSSDELTDDERRFMEDILASHKPIPEKALPRVWALTCGWFSQRWKFKYLDDSFVESFWNRWMSVAKYKIKSVAKGEKLVREKN